MENFPSTSSSIQDNQIFGGELESTESREQSSKTSAVSSENHNLKDRLREILCCIVCLDLPKTAIYQCKSGHLICAGCFTNILLDSNVSTESSGCSRNSPNCPKCHATINKNICPRNIAAEKAISELPVKCSYCSLEVPRSHLENHETGSCQNRLINCCYYPIGCTWRGPFNEKSTHEQLCKQPSTSGADIMKDLEIIDQRRKEDKELYTQLFEMLSFEKITFNDLQFKKCQKDIKEGITFETSIFSAFDNQWLVRAHLQPESIPFTEKALNYQVILNDNLNGFLNIHYMILKGPFGELKIDPKLHQFKFSTNETESSCQPLHLCDSVEYNKLTTAKTINFRLVMFVVNK